MLKHTRIDKWMNIARIPCGGLPFGAPRLPSHPEQAPLQASYPAMAAPGHQARDQIPLAPAQPASHSVAAPMTLRDMTLWFINVLQDPYVQMLLQNSLSGFGEAIEENRERITSLEDEMANLGLELELPSTNSWKLWHQQATQLTLQMPQKDAEAPCRQMGPVAWTSATSLTIVTVEHAVLVGQITPHQRQIPSEKTCL